jgi:magnesium-protoporphyrin O-methyltransferase
MTTTTYRERRGELKAYFDRTAVEAWTRLTSTAPVSRIRATVRAGRDQMRATLLGMLPEGLQGQRLLDAGCGTGALAVGAARRGARVLAVDLSPTLIGLGSERLPSGLFPGCVEFRVGDMLDAALGTFDHIVAMDSLIHYKPADVVRVLSGFAARARLSIVFTFAPKTPALTLMWAVGRLFPRKDRAPAIEPVSETALRRALEAEPALGAWRIGRTCRVASGFYKSQAMELVRA